MKAIIVIIFLFFAINLQAQTCERRGHVPGGNIMETLIYCPDYIIDYADSTVLVTPSCNWITYKCKRCGEIIEEKEKEIRTVIWRRENSLKKLN